MTSPHEIWVMDTCAVTNVRRLEATIYPGVYRKLGELVDREELVYPPQVVDELARFHSPDKADPAYEWVKKHEKKATRFGRMYGELPAILKRWPQLQKVVDVDSTAQEQADLYVLALAHALRGEFSPIVVTDDRKSRPQKLSLADACGILRIVTMSTNPFLDERRLR